MRSRFTAHVAHDYEHLHRTLHGVVEEPYVPEKEEGGRELDAAGDPLARGRTRPDHATVDFTAYYREGDKELAFPEKAEFQKIEGNWIYTKALRQGPAPIKSQAKVGRNDPCPCGSGKKYKQCCLAKG